MTPITQSIISLTVTVDFETGLTTLTDGEGYSTEAVGTELPAIAQVLEQTAHDITLSLTAPPGTFPQDPPPVTPEPEPQEQDGSGDYGPGTFTPDLPDGGDDLPLDIPLEDLSDDELPGLWEQADMTGGRTDYYPDPTPEAEPEPEPPIIVSVYPPEGEGEGEGEGEAEYPPDPDLDPDPASDDEGYPMPPEAPQMAPDEVERVIGELARSREDDVIKAAAASMLNSLSLFGFTDDDNRRVLDIVRSLSDGRPLTQLTNDPGEWRQMPNGVWRSVRSRGAFSGDGGRTYLFADTPEQAYAKMVDPRGSTRVHTRTVTPEPFSPDATPVPNSGNTVGMGSGGASFRTTPQQAQA